MSMAGDVLFHPGVKTGRLKYVIYLNEKGGSQGVIYPDAIPTGEVWPLQMLEAVTRGD
jgi:hypothetical protein